VKNVIFNEDTRVKIPATIQFLRLGYEYQSMKSAVIDFDTKIFIDRFTTSLEKINHKKFTPNEIKFILMDIHNSIRNNDLGKDFYNWLINPIDKVKLIDFDNVENNNFAVVDELSYCVEKDTESGSFRPDINILINGIPFSFLEVKKPNNEGGIQKEFDRMTKNRLKNPNYKKFFNMLQIVAFSNNMEYENKDDDEIEEVKAGSFYSTPNGMQTTFSFFREDDKDYYKNYKYKEIDKETIKSVTQDCGYDSANVETEEFSENLDIFTPCNRFITSIYDKERLLYLIKYGIIFIDVPAKDIKSIPIKEKHIMRYPQFFATRRIIDRLECGGKGGIIWHTQGSGKTALSAFSNRIIRDYYSSKNINSRFFFIVDRLELLRQAADEFRNRGLNVITCNSKEDFKKELNKPLSTSVNSGNIGEIVVVNIQKFDENMPIVTNAYNVNTQRIFFIDEAHRSYSSTGKFFVDLMTCDENGIFIALTGTPILTKKERSNLKFGDYIHKYFYDKSIADGYTLRIKKENIDTVAKTEIKRNLQIEDNQFDDSDIYESDDYIECLGRFILNDFRNFRLVNNDNSIGGMIVCRSNKQAKKMNDWINNNKEEFRLYSGLVMHDTNNPKQAEINKTNQVDFRNNSQPDILVVHYMLTTGYDVKRLKKMYLLRGPKAQSLLQTISRVNRPYKSIRPDGSVKVYKYGYIVDFVDIQKEYNETVGSYIKELENEMNENGENEGSLDGLIIGKEDINKKYETYLSQINNELEVEDVYSLNLERFRKKLDKYNKEVILFIRRLLNGINDCYIEFKLSGAKEYYSKINIDHIKKLLSETISKINFLNFCSKPVDMLNILENEEIVEIMYQFIKTKIIVLNLADLGALNSDPRAKETTDIISEIQKHIKENKNHKDIRIENLDILLNKIFEKLSMLTNLDELDEINKELKKIMEEIENINRENDRLASLYDGHFSFVKSFQDFENTYANFNRKDIEQLFLLIYNDIKDIIDNKDNLLIQGRENFVATTKKKVTLDCAKAKSENGSGLYKTLELKTTFNYLLEQLYTNLLLY
jgi:type I restriction enzyme R subunit